jgi:hypothetical protein
MIQIPLFGRLRIAFWNLAPFSTTQSLALRIQFCRAAHPLPASQGALAAAHG